MANDTKCAYGVDLCAPWDECAAHERDRYVEALMQIANTEDKRGETLGEAFLRLQRIAKNALCKWQDKSACPDCNEE